MNFKKEFSNKSKIYVCILYIYTIQYSGNNKVKWQTLVMIIRIIKVII